MRKEHLASGHSLKIQGLSAGIISDHGKVSVCFYKCLKI